MNNDIREAAKTAKVHLWQIADELGITDFTLSRRLRYELEPQEKERFFEAIKAILARNEGRV